VGRNVKMKKEEKTEVKYLRGRSNSILALYPTPHATEVVALCRNEIYPKKMIEELATYTTEVVMEERLSELVESKLIKIITGYGFEVVGSDAETMVISFVVKTDKTIKEEDPDESVKVYHVSFISNVITDAARYSGTGKTHFGDYDNTVYFEEEGEDVHHAGNTPSMVNPIINPDNAKRAFYKTLDIINKSNPNLSSRNIDTTPTKRPAGYFRNISKLAKVLDTQIRSKKAFGSVTEKPSKKLVTKKLGEETDKVYKAKTDKTTDTVACILDLSGSMNGYPFNESIKFIHALNMVKGIKGVVYLTSGEGYYKLKLPTDRNVIDCIRCDSGAEGFQTTIAANIDELSKQKYVFCLTDGSLVDGYPTEKDKKRLSKAEVLGVYFSGGNKHNTVESNLKLHFGKSLVVKGTEDLLKVLG
jgi:hypothetical protein